jgi:hypothetical protein
MLGLYLHEIYIDISLVLCSKSILRCHIEIRVALKYSAPCFFALPTNCDRNKGNGADNYHSQLTYDKKIPLHELDSLSWNIMLSVGPQVNYFPSFQTLLAIRHADSSAKFICTDQPAAQHHSL